MLITTVVLQNAPPGPFDHAGDGRSGVFGEAGVRSTPLRLSHLISLLGVRSSRRSHGEIRLMVTPLSVEMTGDAESTEARNG